jgi:hypothetical protein
VKKMVIAFSLQKAVISALHRLGITPALIKEIFPTIKLLWGDSHHAGNVITWFKLHLGWAITIMWRLKVPQHVLLVPEGTEVEWDTLFPPGFQPLASLSSRP